MHETTREPLSAYPCLSDDDGLVDAGPVLALPERGPEVRLDRVRRRAGEVRVADVQVRLEGALLVRDGVLRHLVHQAPRRADAAHPTAGSIASSKGVLTQQ